MVWRADGDRGIFCANCQPILIVVRAVQILMVCVFVFTIPTV